MGWVGLCLHKFEPFVTNKTVVLLLIIHIFSDISSRSVKLEVGSPDYMDAPNSKHRKRLLLVYILATSIITIVVISIIFKSF